MVVVTEKPVQIQGGTLRVGKGDLVIPSKLRLLADSGWAITDVVKTKDGFELLLRRPLPEVVIDYEPVSPPTHIGGPRCPMYCNCLRSMV